MLNSIVLDRGLLALSDATALHILTALPVDYDDALAKSIGYRDTPIITGPENGANGARQMVVQPIDDGVVTVDGMAAVWALIDVEDERLLSAKALANAKAVVVGNTFSLEGFIISLSGDV